MPGSRLVALIALAALILSASPSRVHAAATWTSGWQSQADNQILTVEVAPSNGRVVYATTRAGVYQSTDAGTSWSMVSDLANAITLAIDPTQADTLYAYIWPLVDGTDDPKGLRKSTDGGRTWADPSDGAALGAIGEARALVIDPRNPSLLLAGSAYRVGSGQILRSADGGVTWDSTYSIQALMGIGEVRDIDFDLADHNVVYAGHSVYHGGVVVRSQDNGLTWQALPSPPEPLSYPAALATDPDDHDFFYVAEQRPMGAGITLYRTQDGARSWLRIGQNLTLDNAFNPRLTVDPQDPRTVFLSVQGDNNGLFKSTDRGNSWTKISGDGVAVTTTSYASSERILYAGTDRGVMQSKITALVAERFTDYYGTHDGWRILGSALSQGIYSGLNRQYFEKGRIEFHGDESDPNWQYMYGLLAEELQRAGANLPVGGDTSTLNYASIQGLADPGSRLNPPDDFDGGVAQVAGYLTFIPFDAQLQPAPGHNVPDFFWNYMNRKDLFPAGWLHDIGLPMTEAVQATVTKGDVQRDIVIQAFQRTVLTYDPQNPDDWKVERANVGTDYVKAFGAK